MNKEIIQSIRRDLKANIDKKYKEDVMRFFKEKVTSYCYNIGDCPLKLVLGNVL